MLPAAYAALTIVQTAARNSVDVLKVAEVHFTLGQRLGLDRLLSRIVELPRDDRWQTMARAALRDDLHAVHAQLTADVLSSAAGRDEEREGSDRRLGEVEHRRTGVGQDPAVDHRQPGRPGPRLGRPADRSGVAADRGLSGRADSVPHERIRGMRVDLHTHSSVSDGTDEPAALVRQARDAGLDVVALTDHDTFDGLDEAVAAGEQFGVQVVRGMELSCARVGSSVHLLAYGADPASPGLAAEMLRVRGGRMGRLAGVLEKLAELGVPVTEAQVLTQVGNSPSVGRPHIADALIAAGHVRDRQEAFDRFLADGGPAHVHRYAIDIERGIDLVHQAGGLAVIAHPWGRGRERVLPAAVLEALADDHRSRRDRGGSPRSRPGDPSPAP